MDFGWEVGGEDVEFKNLWGRGGKEGNKAIVDFWRGGRWCWHGDSVPTCYLLEDVAVCTL